MDGLENDQTQAHPKPDALLFAALNNPSFHRLLSKCGFAKNDHKLSETTLLLFFAASMIWLLFRSGTKPTRIVYPCQRTAINTVSTTLQAFIPLSLTAFSMNYRWPSVRAATNGVKTFLRNYWKPILVLAIIIPSLGLSLAFVWMSLQPGLPGSDAVLTLMPQTATEFPASDIFVMNGEAVAHVSNLIELMGTQGLCFYQSSTSDTTQGPTGLIATNDVILIKINSQWNCRGGSNTDLLRELIQAVLDHPDGFTGEIVIADNGQGFGSLNWVENNAEDHDQSVRDVVMSFSTLNDVSMFDWQSIRGIEVNEYSDGDMANGYVLNGTADPDTGIYVSYPKFQTWDDTFISFKHGIWNGASYEDRLKIINLPILKSHTIYGVTGALKHYMGVQSEGQAVSGGIANGHNSIARGGMGTLLAQTRYPVLNILDAIWVNANPFPSSYCGPPTAYDEATRVDVLMASTDPVALDYWAARYVLSQTAQLIGYGDTHVLDPDNTQQSGLREAFGIWLHLTEDELVQNGFTVTSDLERMNVYITQIGYSPYDFSLLNIEAILSALPDLPSTKWDLGSNLETDI